MGIKTYRPYTETRRFQTGLTFEELSASRPHKPLLEPKTRISGRNNQGKLSIWHRGGGHKRMYRVIDFKRDKFGIPARVASVEYDPNRTCFISLLQYQDGEKRYILAPFGVTVGDVLESGQVVEPKPGNCMPLGSIPAGLEVHNIEMTAGQGGKMVRGAGGSARIVAKEGDWVTVILPSGEMRMVRKECRATIGRLGNPEYQNITIGKAGRMRHLGIRPHVRGKAQNPVDHPLGGGEGRSNGGRHPCSPSGVLAKGGKTRNPRKVSNSRIIRRRKNRQGQTVL